MLYRDWLLQVFAFIIIGSVFYGIEQFGLSVSVLINMLTDKAYMSLLCYSIYFVLSATILVPLVFGVIQLEINAVTKEKASLSDLFLSFSDTESFTRCYRLFLMVVSRSILPFLPVILTGYFITEEYREGYFGFTLTIFRQDFIYVLLNAALVVFVICGIVLSCKTLLGIYISFQRSKENISRCFFIAGLCIYRKRLEISMLILSFVPLCIISLFTLGFLFVMYTLPYMSLVLVMYFKHIYEKEMYSKNAIQMLYRPSHGQGEILSGINKE